MNEFEALKRLRQETCPATYMPDFNKDECLEVIEKALLELKAIKDAKPSEALGELQNLRLYQCGSCEHHRCSKCDVYKNFNAVNQYILKAQKLEKAWEIVRAKNVDIANLKQSLSVEQYNNIISFKINYMEYMRLTQQEFELLKEVLE